MRRGGSSPPSSGSVFSFAFSSLAFFLLAALFLTACDLQQPLAPDRVRVAPLALVIDG
jgi:hypothetical protein